MGKTGFFTFCKTIVLMYAFMAILLVGLGFEFEKPEWGNMFIKQWHNFSRSLAGINVNNEMGAVFFRESSVLLNGKSRGGFWEKQYREHALSEYLLTANIQALAYKETEAPVSINQENNVNAVNERPPAKAVQEADNTERQGNYHQVFKDYYVSLYCTHSSESYTPDSQTARVDGHGLINEVAEHLSEQLKSKGLQSVFDDTVHDYPDYNKSYTNSRETVNKILAGNKGRLVALFDIHRDSIPGLTRGENITIDNKKVAPILIIVGTDARKSHPDWQINNSFAKRLKEQGDLLYPGLIKAVRTKEGTYNQEYFDHSLLLE
ncbi:MAG: stage II sporulation protein P, partial [Syntrophomonadaceae bacterium]|nr:stage II sporulation protein P [Syntrophomonadaceae bacterium]